jgi:hypothetical protein
MFSKNQWIVPDKYKNGTRFVFLHCHGINAEAGLPAMVPGSYMSTSAYTG